jgi:hypothetical protein
MTNKTYETNSYETDRKNQVSNKCYKIYKYSKI